MTIQNGDFAPDFELKTLDDETVNLADYWQAQPALLIFLRHLG